MAQEWALSSASKLVIPDVGTGYPSATTVVMSCDHYRTVIRPLDGGHFELLSFDSE
ncbi:MAG: hypothetical protein O6853_08340 [Actinobacteria bacterium]|nr:hypothetical protein [Actinomycetota bacterium]MCZ6519789.1 hypothetical protein [Actinomycetota bacterium]MCZ6567784.1 hypothetical protein [Actinomycetota bacterium]MCZ6737107.1 hypothetical protein [Actinomycetota bacterium]